jgi:hypothetical protein
MKKSEVIEQLNSLSDEGLKKCDLYMFDFIHFINTEVAPHLTHKGLNVLKKEYQSWVENEDG